MQLSSEKRSARILAFLIAFVFVFTMAGIQTVSISTAATKAPTKIVLKTTSKTVDVKGKVTVSVKSVKPSTASKRVTWKSSNTKIAKVSKSGVVTGIKTGKVKVTAKSTKNKKIKASISITVKNIKPNGITLNKAKATLETGKKLTLKATVKPAWVYNKGVSFSSNSKGVATVSSKGVVTAVAPGKAVITAKTKENGKTAKCTVTVPEGKILNAWVMSGYATDKLVNNVPVNDKTLLQIWNGAKSQFESAAAYDPEKINGNYAQSYDNNNDGVADLVRVVKYGKDSKAFWNSEARWVKGAGTDISGNTDEPVDDETGAKMFSAKYRIPMGERLLANHGIYDWSGTTDWAVFENSNYWENNELDYYNLESSDTLTMLTGYRTELQTTGSTCVMSSALSVLDWYGVRGDLNERDLSSLRGADRAGKVGGTSLTELKAVFKNLSKYGLTERWNTKTWDGDEYGLFDSEWVQSELAKGHPIMIIWNSFGAHGQVIIGYDNMGTEVTNDDVLILMDPYDTTDHNPDGYTIWSYERLAYGLLTWSDAGTTGTKYMSAWPSDWEYKPVYSDNVRDKTNTSEFSDEGKMDYGYTAQDIRNYYPGTEIYDADTGLSGAAGVERSGDFDRSGAYKLYDFYGTQDEIRSEIGSDTLKLLPKFETIQQSTEWTCGCASALMCLNWFGKNEQRADDAEWGAGEYETDISLAVHRQNGEAGATFRKGMQDIFDYMSSTYGQDWITFTNLDLDDPYGEESYLGDYCLQAGDAYDDWYGLIPYLIENGIPMMIGSDEWGGHWQVIVGYDGMGTEATQDDVLVLADPYDTTDHNQNGFVLKPFERLVYGWGSAFEAGDGYENPYMTDGEEGTNDFIVAIPNEPEYSEVISELGLN